jgi:hypothetical protein
MNVEKNDDDMKFHENSQIGSKVNKGHTHTT